MWYVYIVECSDGTLYTGATNDLLARVAAHNSGKGAKYTRGRIPVKLMYSRACATKEDALKEEYKLKSRTKREKERIIREKGAH